MKLNEAQIAQVTSWVEQGMKVYEIQNLLESEFGIAMTYLDVHLLLGDLEIKMKSVPPPRNEDAAKAVEKPAEGPDSAEGLGEEEEGWAEDEPAGPAGKIALDVDTIAQPGAIVSGKATFSDGQKAAWFVDQMGRLGLVPDKKGYRPSPQDMQDFQYSLQNALARYGF